MEFARTALISVFVAVTVVAAIFSTLAGPSWFWALRMRTRIVGALALVAVLGGGIAIHVRIEREREIVYIDNARTWVGLPLLVSSAMEIQSYSLQLQHAMRMWNDQVGCPLFATAGEAKADVRVIFLRGSPCGKTAVVLEKGAAAGTYYCPDGTADIEIQTLDDIRVAYVVFAHELGHVLGLAHDGSGLMAEAVTSRSLQEQVTPSPKDRDALAERYCPPRSR